MLKQKFMIQFGSSLIVKMFTLIAGIFVARFAGPSVVGVISYGVSFVSIWGFVYSVFGTGHMKLVSEGQDHGNCIATYVWLKTLSIFVFVLFVLGSLYYHIYIAHGKFDSPDQDRVILIYLATAVIIQFYHILTNSFTAMLLQAKANLPSLIQSIIYNISRIIAVVLGAKAIGLSYVQLASAIIVLPLCIKLFRQLPLGSWDIILVKRYLSYGLPTLIFSIITYVIHYADKLFLAHYTNISELGYYSTAMSIGGTFLLMSNSISTVFFPLFSKLISIGDWKTLNQKMSSFQTFNTIFILPFILLFILISKPLLLLLLGVRYTPSIIPLQFILLSTYLTITGMPYGSIITGKGLFYKNVWINTSKLIIFLLTLTFFLSPRFLNLGAIGLSINLLVSSVYSNIIYIVVSRRIGPLKTDYINLARAGVIILLFILFYISTFMFPGLLPHWWVVVSVIFIVVVYAVLCLLKLFSLDHLIILRDVISPQKSFQYISSELRK